MPTLIDGRGVSSSSEEWRHECEARAILAMPTRDRRRCYLYGYTDQRTGKKVRGLVDIRGKAAVEALEQTIWKLWSMRKKNDV